MLCGKRFLQHCWAPEVGCLVPACGPALPSSCPATVSIQDSLLPDDRCLTPGAFSCSMAHAHCTLTCARKQWKALGKTLFFSQLPPPLQTAIKAVLHHKVDPWFFFILPASFPLPQQLVVCWSGLLESPTVVVGTFTSSPPGCFRLCPSPYVARSLCPCSWQSTRSWLMWCPCVSAEVVGGFSGDTTMAAVPGCFHMLVAMWATMWAGE